MTRRKMKNVNVPDRRNAHRKRAALWTLVIILVGAIALPLGAHLYSGVASAQQQAAPGSQTNPRANTWRAVRQGTEGYTSASGPYTTNSLVQNGGQNWRQVRNGPVAAISPWVLAAVVLALGLYALLRGQIKVEPRPSGRTVERWSFAERVLHWYTGTLFIILAITGLSLLFGRAVLIPVLGLKGNGAWAQFAMYVHNYLGPFFVVGVVLEIVAWIKHALPEKTDMEWLRQGGGMLGRGAHPHAGHINAGEKIFTFWIGLFICGIIVSVSGLIMDFPNFGWTRETMQVANVFHAVAAVIWTALILGHIYLGAWGVEGALEGMWRGRVSVEWAKQHHDVWYEQAQRSGGAESAKKVPSGSPRTA